MKFPYPGLCVLIHAIIETGLNAQIKVEPCYEDCKCGSIIGWKEDGLICLDSVCIEDESIIVPSETVRLKTVWHSC